MRGVYFLADDNVIDLAIAFLNSFRKHNPRIALCLIPFSKYTDKIEKLYSKYNFEIYQNKESLTHFQTISLHFFDHRPINQFKKFTIWNGPFDEFIYIDVDTVILENIDFAFQFLQEYDIITSWANTPESRKFVWKDGIYETGKLTNEQINYSANTGFIISRKGIIALGDVDNKLAKGIFLSPYMVEKSFEQSFLNYMIVISGKRYTSLSMLASSGRYPDIMLEVHADEKGKIKDGKFIARDKAYPIVMVHWAGRWQPQWIDRLFKRNIRYFMPHKKLWNYYRFLN